MTDYLVPPPSYLDLEVTAVYDELTLWSSRFGAFLLEHIELRSGERVLDVGCGTGFPLLELANMLGAPSHLVGVDLWHEGLRRAASKCAVQRLTRAELVRGDGARLPFAAGCFHLVVSNLGVNNFALPASTLAECARVLAPGGRLVLTSNLRGHMREIYEIFDRVLASLGRDDYQRRLAVERDHRPSREALTALVASAGLSPVRVIEQACTLRYLNGAAFLRHWLIRMGFLASWRQVVDLADEREVFPRLEHALDEHAREHGGELRLSVPMIYLQAEHQP